MCLWRKLHVVLLGGILNRLSESRVRQCFCNVLEVIGLHGYRCYLLFSSVTCFRGEKFNIFREHDWAPLFWRPAGWFSRTLWKYSTLLLITLSRISYPRPVFLQIAVPLLRESYVFVYKTTHIPYARSDQTTELLNLCSILPVNHGSRSMAALRGNLRTRNSITINKCNKQLCLSLAEISITQISFHSTYTWQFARKKKRKRSRSSYKVLSVFLRGTKSTRLDWSIWVVKKAGEIYLSIIIFSLNSMHTYMTRYMNLVSQAI